MKRSCIWGVAGVLIGLLVALPALAGNDFPVKAMELTPAESQQWDRQVKEFTESLGENGRFQGVPLDGTSIFLLDTRAGHLWVWTFGEKGGFITYQGRVIPGLRMGDIIDMNAKRAGR